MEYPEDLKYTREHEWARVEGTRVVVGITDHAQQELGDIVFLELPRAGSRVAAGKTFGVVESVKAVSDLYSPVTGEIVGVNEDLQATPETVNAEPYGKGWMIAVEMDDPAEVEALLDPAAYRAYVEEEK